MAFVDRSEPLWKEIADVISAEGLELYDLEVASRGSLRVTLSRAAGNLRSPAGGTGDATAASATGASDAAPSTGGPSTSGGVTSGDCSKVCRRLMAFCQTEGNRLGLGPEPEIDVSSPGLDRSLRLPEHFAGAVGSVVRLIPRTEAAWAEVNGRPLIGVLRGTLERVSDGCVHVREERTQAVVAAPISAIKRANVEFMPDEKRAE